MSANAPRYCRCGNRLAWNHASALCGSCERQTVDHRAEPPTVSPAFWHTSALRDALAAQHIGRVAQREPDQAVGIAADVLNATQSLGSYLVISQLIQIQRQLTPYRGNAVVAEFLDCLQDAVRDRLAFYQLTAEVQHPHDGREGL